MSVSTYEDRSYAPIGTQLVYERGDGATVQLQILGGKPAQLPPLPVISNNAALPGPPPAIPKLPAPKPVRRLFLDDDQSPVQQFVSRTPVLPLQAPPALQLAPGITLNEKPQAVLAPTDDSIFDNPVIGGKFTVCVLFYGPHKYHSLHRQCLDGIISTIPHGRLDLRVGSNELCTESLRYIESYVQSGVIRKHYRHVENARKYPVMREMFWDHSLPIETKWLLWFDDDSICDRNRDWLRILANAMVQQPAAAMFGAKLNFQLDAAQAAFYRKRSWFRGKLFRAKNGMPSPNGNIAHFASGGFWALRTDAMRTCDIPDPQLGHNGGDYAIGEQLYQGGFELRAWNGQKQFVHTSSVPRRGLSEPHFGKRANG